MTDVRGYHKLVGTLVADARQNALLRCDLLDQLPVLRVFESAERKKMAFVGGAMSEAFQAQLAVLA
jgi:hypothetical protein